MKKFTTGSGRQHAATTAMITARMPMTLAGVHCFGPRKNRGHLFRGLETFGCRKQHRSQFGMYLHVYHVYTYIYIYMCVCICIYIFNLCIYLIIYIHMYKYVHCSMNIYIYMREWSMIGSPKG